jgi:GT2 family glycosyltransferase
MIRPANPEPRPAASPPSVCLVILNYNGRALLERFLPSLSKTDYQPLEIVVVDNASADDSCAWLQAHWPQVTLLRSPRNLAWAGGNNTGIRYALEKGHRYIVLANNDIEPHPGWIRRAVESAGAHPACGIIGFQLFEEERSRPAFEDACRQLSAPDWRETDNVMGCAMFCDRGVFDGVGLFDEGYEYYFDETDLERRALDAGWRMAALNVPVWHLGEASTRKLGWRRGYLQMRSLLRFSFKQRGLAAGLRAIITVLNRACNPWLRLNWEGDYTLRRYRPASLPVNAALALAAIGWNLAALPQTLRAGRADREKIAHCRDRMAERFSPNGSDATPRSRQS